MAHGRDAARLRRAARPVRLDPAASARTGIGPTAYSRVRAGLRPRVLARWPSHRVPDGLDQLEVLLDQGCLLLHPRCVDAESGVPELRPPADAGRGLAGRAGRPAAPARGPDGRAAGRGAGPVPRGPDRAAAAADRPRELVQLGSCRMGPAVRRRASDTTRPPVIRDGGPGITRTTQRGPEMTATTTMSTTMAVRRRREIEFLARRAVRSGAEGC